MWVSVYTDYAQFDQESTLYLSCSHTHSLSLSLSHTLFLPSHTHLFIIVTSLSTITNHIIRRRGCLPILVAVVAEYEGQHNHCYQDKQDDGCRGYRDDDDRYMVGSDD